MRIYKNKFSWLFILAIFLTACGGETTPTAPAQTPSVGVTNTVARQLTVSPTPLVVPTTVVAVANTIAIQPTAVVATNTLAPRPTATAISAALPTVASTVVTSTQPITTPTTANLGVGKDGVCATLVALSINNLATAQTRFGLDKAITAQESAMKAFKNDARPFEATLNCLDGKLSWTINWTSDSSKQSWLFSNFADEAQTNLQARVKQGLAAYPDETPHKTLAATGKVGFDKVVSALTQKGVIPTTPILSLTVTTNTTPEHYTLTLDKQTTFVIDAVSGAIIS